VATPDINEIFTPERPEGDSSFLSPPPWATTGREGAQNFLGNIPNWLFGGDPGAIQAGGFNEQNRPIGIEAAPSIGPGGLPVPWYNQPNQRPPDYTRKGGGTGTAFANRPDYTRKGGGQGTAFSNTGQQGIGPDWLRAQMAGRQGQFKELSPEQKTAAAEATKAAGTSTNSTGGPGPNVAQPGQNPGTPGTFAPAFNPLAVQLFYQQAIAPMLGQASNRLAAQNADFTKLAQQAMSNPNLPPAYKAIYQNSVPAMSAAQNNTMASLTGAMLNAPVIEGMMGSLNKNQDLMTRLYNEELVNRMLGTGDSSTLDFGIGGEAPNEPKK
jgi:hypothetical protein